MILSGPSAGLRLMARAGPDLIGTIPGRQGRQPAPRCSLGISMNRLVSRFEGIRISATNVKQAASAAVLPGIKSERR